MALWDRLRRDLAEGDVRTGREEVPFLAVSAVLVIVAAQLSEPGTVVDLALLASAGVALVLLATWPQVPVEVAALGVVVPVSLAVGRDGHLEVSLFLVSVMTLYVAWHVGPTSRAVLIAGASCLAIWTVAQVRPGSYNWQPWVGAEIFTLVLGRNLFRQRNLIIQLEAAREALAEQAVGEERRRMARELHDLAGHTLAAVHLHVTGARHVLRRDVDEAERALLAAEAVGRDSLDHIRATVAALRTTELGTDAPLPTGDQIEGLVDEYRRAGLPIDVTIAPEVSQLGGPVAVAVHRIGREALANVARHAPGNRVVLVADVDPLLGHARLSVTDHGGRGAPAAVPDGGFGLVGMHERARSLGGTLVAGPTDDGWCVRAVLPLTGAPHVGATGR